MLAPVQSVLPRWLSLITAWRWVITPDTDTETSDTTLCTTENAGEDNESAGVNGQRASTRRVEPAKHCSPCPMLDENTFTDLARQAAPVDSLVSVPIGSAPLTTAAPAVCERKVMGAELVPELAIRTDSRYVPGATSTVSPAR